MTQTTDLARTNGGVTVQKASTPISSRGLTISNFDELWRVSLAISRSGMAPKGIQSPEAIFTALEFGMELGLGPLAALQSIAVINGRPSIYGDAALALVRGSALCEYFLEGPSNDAVHSLYDELAVAMEFDDRDDIKRIRKLIQQATSAIDKSKPDFGYTAMARRAGAVASTIRRFTVGDAKAAKLHGKQGPWSEYQERMLMFRARGFLLRDGFGDVLKGMRTVEEAGDMPDGPRLETVQVVSDLNQLAGMPSETFAAGTETRTSAATELNEQAAKTDALQPGEITTEADRLAQVDEMLQSGGAKPEPSQTKPAEIAKQEAANDPAAEPRRKAKTQSANPSPVDCSTWDNTLEAIQGIGADTGLTPSEMAGRLNLWLVNAGAKGQEDKKTNPGQRLYLYEAVAEGRLGADGKIVAKQA